MNEQKNNGRGIFYGVIGIATLVVAIVGATFAYFTATAANNIITGNMAKVELSLGVSRVNVTDQAGLIPMSNGMVEAAASSENGVCIDDNGNAVCQIYQITITNSSSAGQFVDGYVALKGGSGEPTDYTHTKTKYPIDGLAGTGRLVGTTMRWAQVFRFERDRVTEATKQFDTNGDRRCSSEEQTAGCVEAKEVYYSTAGTSELGNANVTIRQIGNPDSGANTVNIRTANSAALIMENDTNRDGVCGDNPATSDVTEPAEPGCSVVQDGAAAGVLTRATILENPYDVIGTNYVRVSDHTWQTDATKSESYKRENDITSALVFNDNVAAGASDTYYVVVWLSENGKNQTAGTTVGTDTNPAASGFFAGNVTFISAQGSEVSATFTDYYRVESDTIRQQQQNG